MPATEIFIYSKKKAIDGLATAIKPSDICYYLSDDYRTLTRIRDSLGPNQVIQLLKERFHRAVEEVEAEFMNLSHAINFRNRSDIYWGNALGSRNSGTIPLLRLLVYFHCVRQIMGETSGRLILICDSMALSRVIVDAANNRDIPCRLNFSLRDRLDSTISYTRLILRGGYFLIKNILLWFYARTLNIQGISKDGGREKYILRSWITAGCLDGKGNYRDRNFGVLASWLEEQGKETWTIPMYFNLDRNIFQQMKLMARSSTKFLFSEQCLSPFDYIRALIDGIEGAFIDLADIRFEGREISSIIREVHLRSCMSSEQLRLNSVIYVIKNLSKKKIPIHCFAFPFENNATEKPFILAARKYYPGSPVLGFQHTVWFREQLGMFLLSAEQSYYPLPDRIVTSGRRYAEVLVKAGFPATIISPGPNLRYTLLNHNLQTSNMERQNVFQRILIILNYDMNQSMELLEKAGRALAGIHGSGIYVKAHPTISVEAMEIFLRDIRFPAFEWATGSVQEWVLKSDVVIMTGSSVSNLETIATGVPLIRISLENNFDFDCLWDEYPFAPFISNVNEIHHYLVKAMQMSSEERERLIMFGKEIVRNYFEPVTPENLKVFL